ncbi:BZ3500_MvSof-1268-A1-R1_Chr5-2g07821 [Microbotryum saponariae]|uniref:BZ3500_MvSof-1268-A1-R1_Chr5-2g07821 protein n=1 Tax=Microbotryum saponariae TaxID=289078 RepID=A0A2X0MJF8_9BASI|nr:BZ3500_MvSof-1268-A1-R1_Chr5-2g07821 [Microbotryum saponariae]SDA05690.1 BZ3501_MvSof-1269-A2-R1_Chr5-2g07643 [Microbotryum saponariae]
MFAARQALRLSRPSDHENLTFPLSFPQTRTYATQEPTNVQRGQSKTPFYIAGAVIVLGLGYTLGTKGTPATPAVKGMQEATHPKTPGAREAAGLNADPHDRPSTAGGDQKAKDDNVKTTKAL